MAKILRNTTVSNIQLVEFGATVFANSSLTINVEDYLILAKDSCVTEISTYINNGSIIVNDGTEDLTVLSDAIAFLKYPDDARNIDFNNATNGFTSKTTQKAIEESKQTALALAPIYYEKKSSVSASTSSATFSLVTDMQLTVTVAGDYLAIWDAEINLGDINGQAEIAIFVGGSQQANLTHISELNVALLLGIIGTSRAREGASHIAGKITATAGQVVDVRYRNIGGSTLTVNRRALTLVRIVDAGTIGSAAIAGTQHASTHQPNGNDPLPTQAPVSTNTANQEGTSNSFSRADHAHNTVLAKQSISAVASTNTTTNTPTLLNLMTLTVAVSGTYLLFGNVVFLAANNNTTTIGIYRNGTLITNTNGAFARNANNPMTYAGMDIETLTAGDAIELRWNTSGSIQVTANQRSLNMVRLGD